MDGAMFAFAVVTTTPGVVDVLKYFVLRLTAML